MKYKPLGKSGIEASVVSLGTWAVGGWMWGGTSSENDAVRAIHAAIDNGISMIDTAPVYGMGYAEELVGKAIRGKRDKVVLATKCGLIWHLEKGVHFFNTDEKCVSESGNKKVYRCLSPEIIRYEIENSLNRLKVNTIDLYQTHWQDSSTPIEDTMAELMKLKEEGKIRAVGVCNATSTEMDEYMKKGELDSDQELYNILDRDADKANLPYCRNNKMAFLSYSTLALGLLSGKIDSQRKFNEGDMRNNLPRFTEEGRRKIRAMLDDFEQIADGHNINVAQLALAWAFHQPGCTHVLAGARKKEHAVENAKAGNVVLRQDELKEMKRIIEKHSSGIAPRK